MGERGFLLALRFFREKPGSRKLFSVGAVLLLLPDVDEASPGSV
jgi:hypothetical protein